MGWQLRAAAFAMAAALAAAQSPTPTALAQWSFEGTPYWGVTGGAGAAGSFVLPLGGVVNTSTAGATGSTVGSYTLATWTLTTAANATQGARFVVSTAGYTPTTLTFSARASSTGPRDRLVRVRAALADTPIVVGVANSALTATFESYTLSLAAATAANPALATSGTLLVDVVAYMQPGTSTFAGPGGTLATAGTLRLDDVTVFGVPAASPSASGVPSSTPSPSSSISPGAEASPTNTGTGSGSSTGTGTPSPSGTGTPTRTATSSRTASATPSGTPSNTPSSSFGVPFCGAPVSYMPTLAGLNGTAASVASTNALGWAATISGLSFYAAATKLVYRIDLSGLPMGGSLQVSTCAGTADTVLAVGLGCPTSAASFAAISADDDGCGTTGGPSKLSVTTNVTIYYAVVAAYSSTATGVTAPFAYTYTLPSATRTPTATGTSSRTPTGSVSATASITASISATASASASSGSSESSTPSTSPSPSITSSSSGTGTPSRTPTVSRTASATPSGTPSTTVSPSNPNAFCGAPVSYMPTLAGLNGTVASVASTNALGWAATINSLSFYAAATKLVYRIDLSGLPVGGSLQVSTCAGTADTVLAVGLGCPTSAASFAAISADDDGCGTTGGPSKLSVTTNVTIYYAMVAAYSSTATGVTAPFAYTYTLPSATRTPTVTPTQSRTSVPTATSSASNTASPSGTPSNSATATPTVSAGALPSGTASPSGSSSVTPSASPVPATPAPASAWLVNYTFEVLSAANVPVPAAGLFAASATFAPLGGVVFSSASGRVGNALSITTWPAQGAGNASAGFELCLPTTGYAPATLSFWLRRSNTAPAHMLLRYRVGNGSTAYADIGYATVITAATFEAYSFPLVAALDAAAFNAPQLCLALVAVFAPGTSAYAPALSTSSFGTTGTLRVDDLTLGYTAVPSPAGTPSQTPSLGSSASATPSASASVLPSATRTPTATATPSRTPAGSVSATASSSTAPSPSFGASASQTVSAAATGTPTPTVGTLAPTPTRSGTPTPTATVSTSSSRTPSPTPSKTASGTGAGTSAASASRSLSSTRSGSPLPTVSGTSSVSASTTETPSVSTSGTGSPSPSSSASTSASATSTGTDTPVPTTTASRSVTPSSTGKATTSAAASVTTTKTRLPSASRTRSPTPTKTRTATATATRTKTRTKTKTRTPTKKKFMRA